MFKLEVSTEWAVIGWSVTKNVNFGFGVTVALTSSIIVVWYIGAIVGFKTNGSLNKEILDATFELSFSVQTGLFSDFSLYPPWRCKWISTFWFWDIGLERDSAVNNLSFGYNLGSIIFDGKLCFGFILKGFEWSSNSRKGPNVVTMIGGSCVNFV